MNVNQVYTILNSVAKQIYGSDDVNITNLQGIISLGNDVLSSDTTKDKFLNTLVDRIGKTIVSTRAYSSNVADLINDSFAYGAILQKIYVEPIKASKSETWDLINGNAVDQYIISKPTAKQKLFSIRTTWETDITIPDFQLSSAFTSAEEMSAFINAIWTAVQNSQEVYLSGMAEMCYANLIGERIVDTVLNSGNTVINLLEMYENIYNRGLTPEKALHDPDFLKFSSMQINLFVKKLEKMTTIFNSEGYARFTPKDRLRIYLLADYSTATASYLESVTFHNELVALPKFKELPYWQGIGKKTNFEQTSKINVRTSSGYSLVQDNIIAVLCDEEAIGLTYDNCRSKSAYNSKGEYTNYFLKSDVGYFNDLSENAIIFTIGALAVPTTDTTDKELYTIAKSTDLDIVATLNGSETITGVIINSNKIDSSHVTISGHNVKIKFSSLDYDIGTYAACLELSNNALIPFTITIE